MGTCRSDGRGQATPRCGGSRYGFTTGLPRFQMMATLPALGTTSSKSSSHFPAKAICVPGGNSVLAVCCWLQSARQLHRTVEWSADQHFTVPRLHSTSEITQARAHTSMVFSMWLDYTMSLLPAQVHLLPDDSWLRTRMSTHLFRRPASVCRDRPIPDGAKQKQ